MSDPAPESSKASNGQPQKASLEDLVAALGRPRPDDDEAFAEHDAEELQGELEADAADEGPEEPDPFAEYADLDLATSLPIDPDDNLSKVKGEASPRLMSIIESLLFAADKPMTVKMIRRLLKEPTKRQIQLALKQLIVDTQHRGVVLGQVAGGFRLRTHPDNAQFVQKMLAGKPVRLSRSQLESLAVVAYRQPVTKAELDHIRGVDCGAVLRILLERDLVKIVGRKEEPGRPHLYGTTVSFLEFFNLKGLRDLPDLQEFKELSEESEATLRHTMHGSSLAEEQEAMGQSRIEFPETESESESEAAEAPDEAAASEGQGDDVLSTDEDAPTGESGDTVAAEASGELASPDGEGAATEDADAEASAAAEDAEGDAVSDPPAGDESTDADGSSDEAPAEESDEVVPGAETAVEASSEAEDEASTAPAATDDAADVETPEPADAPVESVAASTDSPPDEPDAAPSPESDAPEDDASAEDAAEDVAPEGDANDEGPSKEDA